VSESKDHGGGGRRSRSPKKWGIMGLTRSSTVGSAPSKRQVHQPMTIHPSILPYSMWFYGKTALTAYAGACPNVCYTAGLHLRARAHLRLLRPGIIDFSAEPALRITFQGRAFKKPKKRERPVEFTPVTRRCLRIVSLPHWLSC
jgi:hypothetical protein